MTIVPTPLPFIPNGRCLCGGRTFSNDFPRTTGGAQASRVGLKRYDAFVARLNSSLTQILQSTYLGGSSGMRLTPLPFIPQRAMSMWRDLLIPPTFLKLLAGRREAMVAAGRTPLWQG
jgi:hypothetical protein